MIAQLAEQEHEPRGGRLARRSQNSGRGNQNLSFLDKYLLSNWSAKKLSIIAFDFYDIVESSLNTEINS